MTASAAVADQPYFLLPLAIGVILLGFWIGADRLLNYWPAVAPWLPLADFWTMGNQAPGFAACHPSEVVVLGVLSIGMLRRGRQVQGSAAIDWLVRGFAAWIAVAALMAAPETDWQILLRPLRLAAMGWLSFEAARASGLTGVRRFSKSAAMAVGVIGAMAWLESVFVKTSGLTSVGQWLGGSETLAILLSFLIPAAIGYGLAAVGRRMAARAGIWLSIGVGISALAMTFSRSGWIGGYAGSLFVAACGYSLHRRLAARLCLIGLVVLGVGAIGVATNTARLPATLVSFSERLGTLRSLKVFAERTDAWRLAFPVVRAHPFVGRPTAPNCYNLYLSIASRSGWPALLIFALLMMATFSLLWRAAQAPQTGILAAGLIGSLLAFAATGVGESSLGARTIPAYMAVVGLAAGLAPPSKAQRRSSGNLGSGRAVFSMSARSGPFPSNAVPI